MSTVLLILCSGWWCVVVIARLRSNHSSPQAASVPVSHGAGAKPDKVAHPRRQLPDSPRPSTAEDAVEIPVQFTLLLKMIHTHTQTHTCDTRYTHVTHVIHVTHVTHTRDNVTHTHAHGLVRARTTHAGKTTHKIFSGNTANRGR